MDDTLRSLSARIQEKNLPLEGIAVYRGDVLRAEARFTRDIARNIYSHTKSYTSAAVGLCVADGLLRLDDKPADFFPEALTGETDEAIRDITLRDMLMMSSGIDTPLLMMGQREKGVGAPDYAKYVLSHPVLKKPGCEFQYSNGDTYLCGRMVEKATGKTLRDFLFERLFQPMDIPYPKWEHDPMGHTFGASGLLLRLTDMCKIGRLYSKGGVWNGRRLIGEDWIRESTRLHIPTPVSEPGTQPWHVGYGYQFWMLPYPGAYRADGAFGQITAVIPEKDAVVTFQCTESDNLFPSIRDIVDEEIFQTL